MSLRVRGFQCGNECICADRVLATECVSDYGKGVCSDLGGECITETDGYYIVSALCMLFGIVFVVAYIIPTARKLQGTSGVGLWRLLLTDYCVDLPLSTWRIKLS